MNKQSIEYGNSDNIFIILSKIILLPDVNKVIINYLKPHSCLNEIENYFATVMFPEKIKYIGEDVLEHPFIKGWYRQLWIKNGISGIWTFINEYQFGHIQHDLQGEETYYNEELPYYDYQSSMQEIDKDTEFIVQV